MAELSFTKEELEQIEKIKAKFPEVKPATLPVLWVAQNKFGHVKPDVQKLVAETLGLPESHVHGVATFYTQYYKEEMGKFVLDVCTCLSCQLCGGYDILHHLEEKLGINVGETTDDGMFSLQEVECLGACGYAPMLQVTNGQYVNNLTKEKVDKLIEDLKSGKKPEFESMKMPQLEKRNQAAS
ncbi:NAD(P)H-dependent oxidoreductase subunit E [Aliifodinibius sp. S!AR15-10]|uniref:NADH-quinone oxidoreductase subunit NuoE family protein n=1 Tax=Aliifodinibius sp. S!AR15-10 TaxID=2950437 RepID=UPI0028670EA3|nr:NAD(P)H-dependent oxidoreductase subunit E [Aliifodinibius sp. S!AR15-10]MDR8392362.1 NAD(P)H-dependent oxidoreductase subunit E [Aliifodinibius sp. S!AR15-10]